MIDVRSLQGGWTSVPSWRHSSRDAGATRRSALLAELLVRIHELPVSDGARPRTSQLWTHPRAVKVPAHATRPSEWERALELIREPPPAYTGCFLHRDFHPGNVLFDATESRVTGVVDWVETSWGPAEFDVAHCSTALTLLHGPEVGLAFGELYLEAGGRLASEPRIRAYWGLIDALHYAAIPDKLAGPWRKAGRTDLTRELLDARLERYVLELASRCA